MMCEKCTKGSSWLLLIIGVIFLIENLLTSWDFWGIQWYTVGFVLLGLMGLGKSSCPGCKGGCCSMPEKAASSSVASKKKKK